MQYGNLAAMKCSLETPPTPSRPKWFFRQSTGIPTMPKSKAFSVIVCVGLTFTLSLLYQHGYRNSNSSNDIFERQEVIEECFRGRRERVRKTCRVVENPEDVACTIRTRVLYFWNYNASICTMGKVSAA